MDGRRSARLVRLPPLTADDARQVVLACRPAATAQEVGRVVAAADGLPFLIEELLAAPGVPRSLTDSVGARLARLSAGERRVIEAAAVLGRQFDWTLLAGIVRQEPEVVESALEHAVEGQLLTSAGLAYRFRHALTADAVTGGLLPHVRARLAAAALDAVDAAHPGLPGSWRHVAADLAAQAGDTDRAARLLRESGQDSLRRGGLATAIDALRRAAGLAREPGLRHDAQLQLVEALALAGRADECEAAGEALLGDLSDASGPAATRAHLAIAQAAASASRWPLADRQLRAAGELLAARPDPVLIERCRLLGGRAGAGGQGGRAGAGAGRAGPDHVADGVAGAVSRLRAAGPQPARHRPRSGADGVRGGPGLRRGRGPAAVAAACAARARHDRAVRPGRRLAAAGPPDGRGAGRRWHGGRARHPARRGRHLPVRR